MMASFDIDVKKMPLGQLTKSQVQKGYTVLEELENAIEGKARNRAQLINEVSSLLHADPARLRPARHSPIDTPELVQKKFDMLNVLNDIEIALGLENKDGAAIKESDLLPNPADDNYKKVKAHLEYVEHRILRSSSSSRPTPTAPAAAT